jgi:hypothetical protein
MPPSIISHIRIHGKVGLFTFTLVPIVMPRERATTMHIMPTEKIPAVL